MFFVANLEHSEMFGQEKTHSEECATQVYELRMRKDSAPCFIFIP